MDTTDTTSHFTLSNKVYDALQGIVNHVLPASGTLYFTLATIWHLPEGTEVVGTIAAIALALGAVLAISKRSYNNSDAKYDGAVTVDTSDPIKDVYSLDVKAPLDSLKDQDQLVLKVTKPFNQVSMELPPSGDSQ